MAVKASGILLYRQRSGQTEVLLVHPGGPFYKRKDDDIWSVPKGLYEKDEDPLAAAVREFEEETGGKVSGPFRQLNEVKYSSGKRLTVFACEGDFDVADFSSNTFEMEWPPGSGKKERFPEVDKAEWFSLEVARRKLLPAQKPLIDEL